MLIRPSGAATAPLLLLCAWPITGVLAQGAAAPTELPAIVTTADRVPEPIQRTGSAISVVSREAIERTNPGTVVDALRNVPGLDVTENGGPGSTINVRIRGANPGQTLVLVDGVRVNDPSGASGDFDFATLLPTAIDRIEVLRGPQSALYGSDAIGGVVNILTRSGGGAPRFESRTEAGSYGTVTSSASASGAVGPWSFAATMGGQKSAGFSRYGDRIGQLQRKFGRFEPDGFARYGGYGRLAYDVGDVKVEIGVMSVLTDFEYDAASSTLPRLAQATGPNRIFPDTPNRGTRHFTQVFARATGEQGPLTQSLQIFANRTDRVFDDFTYRRDTQPQNATGTRTEFLGDRAGIEHQGEMRLEIFGSLIFGGKLETEKANTFSTTLLPTFRPRSATLDATQDTRSVFALWRLPIGERLLLSLGGRHDEVNAVDFNTWRATAAYLIPESGTKLRASGGTGGKAPTLFQLFSPLNGNAALAPEFSIGWDAGIDQSFWDGRVQLSGTVFQQQFRDLISFDGATQRYFNTARAETSGLEIEGSVEAIADFARLTGAYTFLRARDLATNLTLQRRPAHVGRIGLALTPLPGWLVEPRVTMVSRRFSGNNETLPLVPYARFDVYSEYEFDQTWKVFGRVENITGTRYQEILNYATTGRAVYAGLNVTW